MESARKLVFSIHPDVSERIMYEGIMFSPDKDFGGLFVSKHPVSFEFSTRYNMKDPKKILEGTGKFRRHLKLRSLADLKDKEVNFFVRQI